MKISESDSDTSFDSDTSEAEVSHTEVEESDIPPSRSSNVTKPE